MAHDNMHALVVEVRKGGSPNLVQKSIPLPALASNQVLVKVATVAQNPTDVQAFDTNYFDDGAVLGCDFAGTVEAVGSDVTRVSKGDTIAGLIWGGEIKGVGAYSEYTIADESICFKVPASISVTQAAAIPLAALTSWLALFSKDSLDIDRNAGSDATILIWGGSSSVGLYAIQIAALHGFNIVTTCSPRHFERVQLLGAKHAFDYRDPNIVQLINDAAPGLAYVFDTIGNETSSVLASQAVDERGAEFCEKLPALIEEGKIKPTDIRVVPGGLEGVAAGFQEHRDGKISATKLVYEL
ncbi:hypothetical protein QQX98_001631 [Neonectria punicea]|uniref:Enoyl reductase (ER) domain-containing protein n=1 Tax=Neonectria punicea TaxID=979145 RepID=A0ABR1HMI5_9HYPO